jgi:hypothetical protein
MGIPKWGSNSLSQKAAERVLFHVIVLRMLGAAQWTGANNEAKTAEYPLVGYMATPLC